MMVLLGALPKCVFFRPTAATSPMWRFKVCSGTPKDGGLTSVGRVAHTTATTKRTHMNHGNPDFHRMAPPDMSGPRRPIPIGLDAAKHTGNILRLLEASHGSYSFNTIDTLSTVWHHKALCWAYGTENKKWTSMSPFEALTAQENDRLRQYNTPTTTTPRLMMPQQATSTPRLQSLTFSDDRTALVKLLTGQGNVHYLSILRLDENTQMNDGWIILREIQVPSPSLSSLSSPTASDTSDKAFSSLRTTIRKYVDIEHGGGLADAECARDLFAPQASLLSVGMADPSQPTSDWSAPVGRLLEVPLQTYLAGVQAQTAHDTKAMANDMIVNIDIRSATNVALAASATVRVGNGTKTLVFEDHLLLGSEENSLNSTNSWSWKILSKTFSPQPWPLHHVDHHSNHDHHHDHDHS